MNSVLDKLSYRTIDRILEQSHLRACAKISLDCISHHEVIDRVSCACEDMLITLDAKIYTEHLGKTTERVEVQYPRDWWQMLKYQHAPKWVIDRFPVQMRTHVEEICVSFGVVYPDFKPANNMQYHVITETEMYNHD